MLNLTRKTKINNLTYLIEEEKILREKLIDKLTKDALKDELKETVIDLYNTQQCIEMLTEDKNKLLNEEEMEIK